VDGKLEEVPDSSLLPPDAIAALRSLPRRFRATVLPTPEDMPTPDAVRTALDAAGRAAQQLDAVGAQLRRVLLNDNPELGTPPAAAPGDPGTALDRVTSAANAIAELAASQPASAWVRTGRRDGATVTAADLLREAVDVGVGELRVAERAWDRGGGGEE
jgi:hypothetical protein